MWHHAVLHRWWGADARPLAAEQQQVGKEHTQKLESKPIKRRPRIKRLVRRTRCFAKTEGMHDLVLGLFINRYECGRLICTMINTFATPSREKNQQQKNTLTLD